MSIRGAAVVGLCLLFCLLPAHGYPDRNGWYQKIEDGIRAAVNVSDMEADSVTIQGVKPAVGVDRMCDYYEPPHPPGETNTVHELTPHDVRVIGAMGDSITAALFAKSTSLLDIVINRREYRGISWSIGGDQEATTCATVPNFIKKYSPNVLGYAIKDGDEFSDNANLDVGISGAVARDLAGDDGEARVLVNKIKKLHEEGAIDYYKDWKVITVWIGANDQCAYCGGDKTDYTADLYINWVNEALLILSELPRTFVNLVLNADMTEYSNFKGDLVCSTIHAFACSCATVLNKGEVEILSELYREKLKNLVLEGEYEREDFTIVIQPFFGGVVLPKLSNGNTDKSYFAPDCFHLSPKGHKEVAVGLWNNMVEPVGSKTATWTIGSPLVCPTKDAPYFYTAKNSEPKSFGAASSDASYGDAGADPQASGSSNPVGVIVGSAVGAYVAIVGVVLVIGGVWFVRRRRSGRVDLRSYQNPSDRQPLVEKKC